MIITLTLLLVTVVAITGVQLQNSSTVTQDQLSQIYLRKDELIAQQEQLDLLIAQLNTTLQTEVQKNSDLKVQLDNVTQTNAAIEAAKTIQAQTVTTQPAPAPAPVKKVVTRAS